MISYKQSIRILKKSKIFIKNEIVKTNNCLNRIVANTIKSNANNPSGDNAAFDGFVINSSETNNLSKKNNRLHRQI